MIDAAIGIGAAVVAGGIAYGDLRYQIGKLKGKMELIETGLKVIIDNNNIK